MQTPPRDNAFAVGPNGSRPPSPPHHHLVPPTPARTVDAAPHTCLLHCGLQRPKILARCATLPTPSVVPMGYPPVDVALPTAGQPNPDGRLGHLHPLTQSIHVLAAPLHPNEFGDVGQIRPLSTDAAVNADDLPCASMVWYTPVSMTSMASRNAESCCDGSPILGMIPALAKKKSSRPNSSTPRSISVVN